MSAWALNHGNTNKPRNHSAHSGINLTHYSAKADSHELLLYSVEGSGHRLSRRQMGQAIDYMGVCVLRHSRPMNLKKPTAKSGD